MPRCRAGVRLAKLATAVPAAAGFPADGELGVAHALELARVAANPRCGDQVAAVAERLVHSALHGRDEVFADTVREWERLADADGAHRHTRTAHEGRGAWVDPDGDTVVLRGEFGTVQGDMVAQVFAAFCDAEFAADWEQAVALFGAIAVRVHGHRRARTRTAPRSVSTPCGAGCGSPRWPRHRR